MGLLTEGVVLSSEESLQLSSYIREHGIEQFLVTWNRVKDIQNDELRFGDEIEVGIVKTDPIHKTAKICIKSAELRTILIKKEKSVEHQSEGVTWHPEFGGWMIESTPSRPYTNYVSDLLRVERNMVLRRRRLLSVLGPNEIAPTVTCFPLLGVGDFIDNPLPFDAHHSKSSFLPDYIINPHPRFAALTNNIRERRGNKVDIQMPLFHDVNTPEFLLLENKSANVNIPLDSLGKSILEPDTNIHMDAMAFGMGMCCLQVTFQGRDVDESRYMYDQLAVLAPIMLAMTAATPIFKGRLANVDARWDVIAQSVDDRTAAERGEVVDAPIRPYMAGGGVRRLFKSRYGSISTYIYHCRGDTACHRTFAEYNDIPCPVDDAIKARLRGAGVDENLAHHVAHLFTRDPLVIFDGKVELDDQTTTEHFENIQSTNWQTCRWKPPPPRTSPDDPHIGWRTEFRSMEVALTDFENAAFTVFVVLVTRVVLAFDLALYIPLSKVDENMSRAHLPNAATQSKFHFRKFVAPICDPSSPRAVKGFFTSKGACDGCGSGVGGDGSDVASSSLSSSDGSSTTTRSVTDDSPPPPPPTISHTSQPSSDNGAGKTKGCTNIGCYEEMSMEEIFNGKGGYYPGLIPLVYAYLDYVRCDSETFKRLDEYLQFIARRARGELITPATWMRTFVTTHPSYQQDSIITPEIAHDLLIACDEIGKGLRACPEMLGTVKIDRVRGEDAYGQVLAGRLNAEERSELLQNLIRRAHMRRPEDLPRGTSEHLWGLNHDTDSNGNSTTTEGNSGRNGTLGGNGHGEAEQKGGMSTSRSFAELMGDLGL